MLVHRCRFVGYQPLPIHCIAFESPQVEGRDVRVAISRGNADVEIWNVSNDWHLEKTIPGGDDMSVEALVWRNGRLFAAGLHSLVLEYDLATTTVKTSTDSLGGPVWSLAMNHAGTTLAAGCEDGSIKLFDIRDGGLEFLRTCDRQDGRVLSLAWHASDHYLVAGTSDSSIRVWNVVSNRLKLRITVQDEKRDKTLVWGVRVLKDMTIVSVDSCGRTQFWNGQFGTLRQSFGHHEADVLTIAVTADEQRVFTAGVDNKIVVFHRLADGKWAQGGKMREHSHDVRALAVGPNNTLVSGGVDTNIISHPLDGFGLPGATHTKIPPYPQRPRVFLARDPPLMMYQHQRKLQLWRLGEADEGSLSAKRAAEAAADGDTAASKSLAAAGGPLNLAAPPELLLEMVPRCTGTIVCSAMAHDGSHVAFSTAAGTRVFRLVTDTVEVDHGSGLQTELRPERLRHVSEKLGSAQAVVFTEDGRRLIACASDGSLRVLELSSEEVTGPLSIPEHVAREAAAADAADDLHIACMLAVSSDGQWVAVTWSRVVYIFNLDTLQYHTSLARLPSPPTAMAFNPASGELVTVCVNHHVFVHDVETGVPTDWCKAHGSHLPKIWRKRKEKVIDISFDPANPSLVILADYGCVCKLDISKHYLSVQTTIDDEPKSEEKSTAKRAVGGKKKGKAEPTVEMNGNGNGKAADRSLRKRKKSDGADDSDSDSDGEESSDSEGDAQGGTDSADTRHKAKKTRRASNKLTLKQERKQSFRCFRQFQPLLHASFCGASQVVVVERPWLSIMENFPPALYRARYGM